MFKKLYKTNGLGTHFLYMKHSYILYAFFENETIPKNNKMVSFQRNITKPIVSEHAFVYMQKSKSVISKVWNGTTSKIHKVVSCQNSITKPMVFLTPCFIHANILRFWLAKFEMKPFQKCIKWFHLKETLQNQCIQQPSFQSKQISRVV